MPKFYRIGQRAFSRIPFTNKEGKKKQMRKSALFEIRVKKRNFFSVGVDLVDVTGEPSLERAGLSYGGF